MMKQLFIDIKTDIPVQPQKVIDKPFTLFCHRRTGKTKEFIETYVSAVFNDKETYFFINENGLNLSSNHLFVGMRDEFIIRELKKYIGLEINSLTINLTW